MASAEQDGYNHLECQQPVIELVWSPTYSIARKAFGRTYYSLAPFVTQDSRIMVTFCKKQGAAFWIALVAIICLIAYPLSLGPMCWVMSRVSGMHALPVADIYYPVLLATDKLPPPAWRLTEKYCQVFAAPNWSLNRTQR